MMSPHRLGQQALIDLEVGQPWYVRSEPVRTNHRLIWSSIDILVFFSGNSFYSDIFYLLVDKHILRDPTPRGCISCAVVIGVVAVILLLCTSFFVVVSCLRFPGPYRLRRSEKLSFDCAFVVVCSCWIVYMRDQMNTTILGLIYCFHVIPLLNLWWDYTNFGFWDCALTALIEAALFLCRGHVVLVVAVAGVGVALQLKKNSYQEKCIKSSMEK